jgi:hypothetical protein
LGGDEVHMAKSCFEEVGSEMFDYNEFETTLQEIIRSIGYNESQIIRWEMTTPFPNLIRTGDITHFWFSYPDDSDNNFKLNYGRNFSNPAFLSTNLYFDVNKDDSAWEVYVKTKKLKNMPHQQSPIKGIIAATFELGTKFWLERNVVGRLLAVSLGASEIEIMNDSDLNIIYVDVCKSVGFLHDLCYLYGRPPGLYDRFRESLVGHSVQSVWEQWKNDTCTRLTESEDYKIYHPSNRRVDLATATSDKSLSIKGLNRIDASSNTHVKKNFANKAIKEGTLVKYSGALIELRNFLVRDAPMLDDLIHEIGGLGMNLAQVRLLDDFQFAYEPKFSASKTIKGKERLTPLNQASLLGLRESAEKVGVLLMPELSVTTNVSSIMFSFFGGNLFILSVPLTPSLFP